MKKIIIESYLATLAILLLNTVNVRSDPGVQLSSDSWKDINCNAMTEKNGERLKSLSKILANVNYKDQTHFFDLIFGKMIAATAKRYQLLNKCIIKQCVSDIVEVGLDNNQVIKNANLVRDLEKQSRGYLYRIDSPQLEFGKEFVNHLRKHIFQDWELMNINSFCAAQACVGELVRNGFKHLRGTDNVAIAAELNKNSTTDSEDIKKSDLVIEYKTHLLSDALNKKSIEHFCAEKACLHQLWSVSFKLDMDGKANLAFYNANKNTIDIFLFLNYVMRYVLLLLKNRNNVKEYTPKWLCDHVGKNDIL